MLSMIYFGWCEHHVRNYKRTARFQSACDVRRLLISDLQILLKNMLHSDPALRVKADRLCDFPWLNLPVDLTKYDFDAPMSTHSKCLNLVIYATCRRIIMYMYTYFYGSYIKFSWLLIIFHDKKAASGIKT